MSLQYEFVIDRQENLLEGLQQANVLGFKLIRSKNSKIPLICIRQGPFLISYRFDVATASWKLYWKENIFGDGDDFDDNTYPWFVDDILGTGSDIIAIRTHSGLAFLRPRHDSRPGTDLLTEDSRFGGWRGTLIILMGNFYSDKSTVGLFSRNSKGEIEIYSIGTDKIESQKGYPLDILPNLQFSVSWKKSDTKTFLTDLRRRGKDVFVLHTVEGLEIHEFDHNFKLIELMRTKIIKRSNDNDTLFFGHFTNKNFKDIIQLNDDGLFLYKYKDEVKDFALVHHNVEFSLRHGWRSEFVDSIKILDINNDGTDHLVFTGTNGLNEYFFNASLMKWESILNASQLQGLLRYSKIIGLVRTDDKPTIFSQDSNGSFQSLNVIPSKSTNINLDEDKLESDKPSKPSKPFEPSTIIPSIISRMSYHELPILRWTEQWDDGFLKEAVRPQTGQVEFSIPLVKAGPLPALQSAIGISYNSQDASSELLGIGWTIPIADYYISVDHKGSIYAVDYDYYLIREGRQGKLIAKRMYGKTVEFELKEQPELKITYDMNDEKWYVGNDVEEITFGISNDNKSGELKMQLNWPNWNGRGTDTSKLKPYIQSWYLSERRLLNSGSTIFYQYESTLASIAGKSYTTSIRLMSISDGNEFEINFEYSAKTEKEYKNLSPIDADKIVTFPIPLVHTHYLKSCTVQTSIYQQRIDFNYQLLNDARLLVQISQPIKGHTESIFKFDYKNDVNHSVMSTCKFMEKSLLNFDYTKTASLIPAFSLQYQVHDRPQIAFGSDYAIMAYKSKVEVNFRLTNVALTIPMFKGTTSRPGSNGVIQTFVIRAYDNSFIISQTTGFQIEVHTFTRSNSKWSNVPSIETFHQQSLTCFSATFYAIAEPNTGKLIIIERDYGRSEWKRLVVDIPGAMKVRGWSAQNHIIVGHDDSQLLLCYKNEQNKWTTDVIDRHEIYQSSRNTMALFEVDSETKKDIISIYDSETLQMFNNMIVASGVHEKDGKLMVSVKFYLLDANRKIATTFVEQISSENLFELKLEKEYKGTTFIIKYYKSENKYRMKIVDFTGKLLDEFNDIKNENGREDAKNARLNSLNQAGGWKEFFGHSIIFNPSLYRCQLSKDGLFIGENTFLRMNGMEWKKEHRPAVNYVRLGESFILGFDQKDTKSVYLHHQKLDGKPGQLIKHIKLHDIGQFINRYPAYLGFHLTEKDVTILTFNDPKTLGKEVVYPKEELLSESNLTNLMTVAKLDGSRYEWRVRSLANFMEQKFYSIVEKWSITNDNVSRTTSYERSSKYKSKDGVVEESLRIIPGGSKTVSGWIEHILVNNLETQERNITTNYYNSSGKLVSADGDKAAAPDASKKVNEKGENGSQIFDKTGHMEISNFMPYKVSDDEVVFFGFESYEENQGMEFDVNAIVRGKFALTGDSYLNLKKGAKLRKIFNPKNTNNIFIASCYVRSSSPMKLKSEVTYLRALVSAERITKEIPSKILRESGEWSYLESYIDLITLNRELGQLQGLQITLEVTSGSANSLDIDHIRFSPLTQNFEATVFNPESGKVTAKITDSGLVSRTIFDRQHREIGVIKTNEQIEHFTRATKTGELVPPPRTSIHKQPSSKIKFEPESGFYENFDKTAFMSRWSVSNAKVWSISRGQLIHRGVDRNTITANANLINESCAAVRFGYNLRLIQSSLTLRWSSNISITLTSLIENQATLTLNAVRGTVVDSLPVSGELLIFIEVGRIVVWIDGVLVIDQGHGYGDDIEPWSDFTLEMVNYLVIEDLFIMNRPRIFLEYFNGLSEKVQVLQFESDKIIQVSQTLYDELGRDVIVTKPTKVSRDNYQTLFAFYPEFVQNEKPMDSNSVFKTGLLKGDVDILNRNDFGVPYMRTEYDKSPLNEKISEGLPGAENSISGPNAKRYSKLSPEDFLTNMFPTHFGYRQQTEMLPNGSEKVSVFDVKKNIVARYTRVVGFNHILSTSEYDEDNQLVKLLPPLYHEIAGTAFRVTPWRNGDAHLTETEKKLQETYGSHFVYKEGRLIEKRTPDAGTIKYMYTAAGALRFMVTMGLYNAVHRIVYFVYDEYEQLVRSGHLATPMPVPQLEQYLYGDYVPNTVDYQLIQYSDQKEDPMERGFMKSLVTHRGSESVQEIIRFNDDLDVSSRDIYALPHKTNFESTSSVISISKEYNRKQLSALVYPGLYKGKAFKLMYTFDKLGNIISLGTETNHKSFASFTYLINGLVASETLLPTSSFQFSRIYEYNSPGFLKRISDRFLTEDLSYTHGGYGMNGFGDGTILLTTFNAKWSNNVDPRMFLVKNVDNKLIPPTCIDALKRLGYLNSMNSPIKFYIPATAISMPQQCHGDVGLRIAKLVAEKQIPSFYGFRFAYGSHKELINAKYFTNETFKLIEPLQGHSFTEFIPNLSKERSEDIFEILSMNKFILRDRRSNIGRRGLPFFRYKDLERDLKELDVSFDAFTSVLVSLLTLIISQRKSISLDIFEKQFLKWCDFNRGTTKVLLQDASYNSKAIFEMLVRKGYMTQTALHKDFINILTNYQNVLPEIVGALNHHFVHALGETPFDVESFNNDANGNHEKFSTGFERYEFHYKNGTNQISAIKIDEEIDSQKAHKMVHDIDGNVVQALHKNIEEIEYDKASQRTTSIRMTDGRKLLFYYDGQGERILKRVLSASGVIATDKYYIRDENGKVLLERQITYFPAVKSKEIAETMYIYGPRGLIGFIRNDKFHIILTDHAGSIRLIIRDGLVIAAMDYLPYGQIMRLYSTNPLDLIAYRYTGQEFDEETGLYNYHARLYDPQIGRFYQIDPQAQYYSPYKYAGNSPESFVDPDSEFGLQQSDIATLLIVGGAYIGGAANSKWNPSDWNFKDSGTGIGIVGGGMMPTNIGASTGSIGGTVTLGAGGLFMSTDAANGNWNAEEWKWDSPQARNAMFHGFATGASLAGGAGTTHKSAKTFTTAAGSKTFLVGNEGTDVAAPYRSAVMANDGNAAFWQYDLTSADTWQSLLVGFDSGMPSNFVDVGRSLKKLAQTQHKLRSFLSKTKSTSKNMESFKNILKDSNHPLFKVAVVTASAYNFIGAENGDFDVPNWKNMFGTYDGLTKGLFYARDTNEKIISSTNKIKTPKPEMIELISNKKIDPNRVRRFAKRTFDDEIYLSATLMVSSEEINSTDFDRSVQDQFNDSMISTTSGSQPITFWPLSLLRIIKSAFYLTNRYVGFPNGDADHSKSIPPTSRQEEPTTESSFIYSPDKLPTIPGIQFDEFEHSSDSLLDMGDQWVANTNMQGNLMWAFILCRKLFGYKSDKSKLAPYANSTTELGIQAYEIVNKYIKDVTSAAVSSGIEHTIHAIIESGTLDHLVHSVKIKLMRGQHDDVPTFLQKSVVGKNMNKISRMSSPKQVKVFEDLVKNFNDQLYSCWSDLPDICSRNADQNNFSNYANSAQFKCPLEIHSKFPVYELS